MLHFAKPDGSAFDLDYFGDIHVFDAGKDRIAICVCSKHQTEVHNPEVGEALEDLGYSREIRATPEDWDCWEILVSGLDDHQKRYLQGALASAYSATHLASRILADINNES